MSSGRRIIPAYAGSTTRCRADPRPASDHPRIRGEHARGAVVAALDPGSSPHTRGALHPTRRHRPRPRIIPAYAGSTPPTCLRSRPATDHPRIRGEHTSPPHTAEPDSDHPRIRGEHVTVFILSLIDGGSSPHTRGARVDPWEDAGPCWDHPRIRGEHSSRSFRRSMALGSSPHTRGALKQLIGPGNSARIIPAYAGSTSGS